MSEKYPASFGTLLNLWHRVRGRLGEIAASPPSPGHVLVTGATGFIGWALVSKLTAQAIPVRVLVHLAPRPNSLPWPHTEAIYTDLAAPNMEALRRAVEGCDTVFHLAAFSDETIPQRLYTVNVRGTKVLTEAALDAGVKRFILTSTLATVGRVWNDPNGPGPWQQQATHYVRSRFLAEEVALIAGRKGLMVTVLNLPTVVAPRMPSDHPFVEWLTRESHAWCTLPDAAPIHLVTLRDVVNLLVWLVTERTQTGRLIPLALDELLPEDVLRFWETVEVSPTDIRPLQFTWRDHPPLYYRLTGTANAHVIRLPTPARPVVRSLMRHAVKMAIRGRQQLVRTSA